MPIARSVVHRLPNEAVAKAAPMTDAQSPVGRPMRKLIVGIDIGGTKVAGGLVTPKGWLVKSSVVPTHAAGGFKSSFGQIVGLIESLIRDGGGPEKIIGIGMCAPGPINPKTGSVINPPNLPGWRNVQLERKVHRHFRLPAKVENDANAAGLAEALFGAARRYRDVFYVTVSTGIGTGIIINKRVYHGKNGVAGEGGHVSIDYRSPWRCGCGTLGCIEALAAGPAMARRALARLAIIAARLRALMGFLGLGSSMRFLFCSGGVSPAAGRSHCRPSFPRRNVTLAQAGAGIHRA
jgi:predicted NBD/HSP70 family sugar kinase